MTVLAALAVLLVAALVTVVVLANREPSSPGNEQAGGPSGTPSPKGSSAPTSSSAASPPSAPGGTGATPGTAPAGYTLYRDLSGFSVAVPDGWRKTRVTGSNNDGQFDFNDPTNPGRFLRFGYTTAPKDDPVADWEAQEGKLRARHSNYRRISIEAVKYRTFPTADWDFTLGSTRVKNRGFKAGASHGYAIYLSAPGSQWTDSMKYFQVAAGTFKPAP